MGLRGYNLRKWITSCPFASNILTLKELLCGLINESLMDSSTVKETTAYKIMFKLHPDAEQLIETDGTNILYRRIRLLHAYLTQRICTDSNYLAYLYLVKTRKINNLIIGL